jgi:hypothetical protein
VLLKRIEVTRFRRLDAAGTRFGDDRSSSASSRRSENVRKGLQEMRAKADETSRQELLQVIERWVTACHIEKFFAWDILEHAERH